MLKNIPVVVTSHAVEHGLRYRGAMQFRDPVSTREYDSSRPDVRYALVFATHLDDVFSSGLEACMETFDLMKASGAEINFMDGESVDKDVLMTLANAAIFTSQFGYGASMGGAADVEPAMYEFTRETEHFLYAAQLTVTLPVSDALWMFAFPYKNS